MVKVTVAAYGPMGMIGEDVFDGPAFNEFGDDVRWDERDTVELEVEPSATLAEIIDEAAAGFGITVAQRKFAGSRRVSDHLDGVAFYTPEDDQPGAQPYGFSSYLLGLDADGKAVWGLLNAVSIGDLIRAREAGLTRGDPTRIYLWPTVPQGGEVLLGHWEWIAEALPYIWIAMDGASRVEGAIGLAERIKNRLSGRAKLKEVGPSLREKGAGPAQVDELIRRNRLSTGQIARLLDIDEEQAEAFLQAFGYELDENGIWVAGRGLDAIYLRRATDLLLEGGSLYGRQPSEEAAEGFFIERVEATIVGGRLESADAWRVAWRGAEEGPRDEPPAEPESADEEFDHRVEFKLVAADIEDAGVDLQDLERALGEAAGEDFEFVESWSNVLVKGRGRALVILLKKEVWTPK